MYVYMYKNDDVRAQFFLKVTRRRFIFFTNIYVINIFLYKNFYTIR